MPADESGMRTVVFELNGYARRVQVRDRAVKSEVPANKKVTNPEQEVGAPLQGKLSKILVKTGDAINANTPLFIIEAMKMETTVTATRDTKVKSVVLREGTMVQQDDLVVELE
jgi:pyruvate carboxylase